jgi:hypothetical protein
MHSTRSGIATKTDVEELTSTLNWFTNPDGASAQWVLSEKERVRVVADALIAWHSTYLNGRSWGIEMTQPTIDRPYRDGHYANAALVGRHYVVLGVAPVWLDYWDGGDASGFVAHEDTIQGRESGKSDPGPQFDRARFIASLQEPIEEDDMKKLQPVKDSGTTVYVTNFINKWPLTAWVLLEEMWQKDIAERSILTLSDKLLASIPSAGRRKAVSLGATAAEVADELARRLAK